MPSRRSILPAHTSCNVFHAVILAVILALVANIPVHGQTFTVLHSFSVLPAGMRSGLEDHAVISVRTDPDQQRRLV